MFSTYNPSNLAKISEYQYIDSAEIENIIQKSNTIFVQWGKKGIAERLNFIKTLINSLTKNKDLLAKTASEEMGKPLNQSVAEIDKCMVLCQFYLQNADFFLKSHKINADGTESYVNFEPLGVILGVMPWNFP